MKRLFFVLALTAVAQSLFAQAAVYTDPAQAFNKLLLDNSEGGTLTKVNNFNVQGSPFLFGEKHTGNFYAGKEQASNIVITYNTYNQELGFISTANPNIVLVKQVAEVDSFLLFPDKDGRLKENLFFINGKTLGLEKPGFLQVVSQGARFKLYKRYYSELGYASTNYIDPELRQFDLKYEYYYTDTQNPGLNKIKNNSSAIRKQFKSERDISSAMNNYGENPEAALKLAFLLLNS